MSRSLSILVLALAVAAMTVLPALAAEPAVSKRVMTEDDGTAVLIVEVRAAARAIYGVTLTDETGSVTDVVSPKGWAGISSGDRVVFATVDRPVGPGETVAFRVVTTNKSAPLGVSFRDAKSLIHTKQSI